MKITITMMTPSVRISLASDDIFNECPQRRNDNLVKYIQFPLEGLV